MTPFLEVLGAAMALAAMTALAFVVLLIALELVGACRSWLERMRAEDAAREARAWEDVGFAFTDPAKTSGAPRLEIGAAPVERGRGSQSKCEGSHEHDARSGGGA